MGMINNFIDEVSHFQDLNSQYAGYESRTSSQIEFYPPTDSFQEKKAKSVRIKDGVFLFIFTVIFGIVGILCLVAKEKQIFVGIICLLIALFTGRCALSTFTSGNLVMTGYVVYKHSRRGSGRNKGRTYYVTVRPENGDYILYKDIQISKKDYHYVAEGSPVLVVKTGLSARACTM